MSLENGQLLSHYRVLSRLGAGGMGEVYLAEDVRLGRKLALKIVAARLAQDEDRLQRFQWEARSVSALNHPNVITIYDIGEADGRHFIATEFIDGETLRARVSAGPLPPALAVDLLVQTARGLEAAHALGIVHRDIKPENVMIRPDGLVKVLDFGLAKLVSDDSPASADVTSAFATLKGEVLGTVAYMSPEQARGLLVDARSDVFSLGVVCYEMLSGRSPFLGETPIDTLAAVLNREPASLSHLPGVGAALDQAVRHALEKDRDRRWPSTSSFADAVREAIGGVTASEGRAVDTQLALNARATGAIEMPAAPARETSEKPTASSARSRRRRSIDSLAVLPFVNASRDDELEYLGDGLTECLINNLSQIPNLRVMARGTVYRYKGRDADPQQIGRELGVKVVLTGRIVQVADRFRIAVELADAGDGSQIWGSQFTRAPSDLLLVEEEIAREVSDALKLSMATAVRRRLRRSAPASASALELYLKGRYFWHKRSQDALRTAADFFERAIADDPNFAPAHSGLADSYALMGAGYTADQGLGRIDRAREAAERALALDETLAEAHASLAYIKLRFDWEWEIAEREFRAALSLNPGHVQSIQWYGMFLASRGRSEEAMRELTRARELDPLSQAVQSGIGRVLHFEGRYDEAIAAFTRILQTDPSFTPSRLDLSLSLMAKGELDRAVVELDAAAAKLGNLSSILMLRAWCDAKSGRMDLARATYTELEAQSRDGRASCDELALLAILVGDEARAPEILEEACQRKAPLLTYVNVEPIIRHLLHHAPCRPILRRYGLLIE
jgi:eukaryotic-like serine/threonine-protein kinase